MTNSRERIGIFGGSFNPIHTGHLIMAQDAESAFALSRILFVPAALPPHKDPDQLIAPECRLDMVRLALSNRPAWEVCDFEVRRGGVSYSIDTVRHVSGRFPGAELFFIIGGDTLPELPTWREIDTLMTLCRFAIMVRPGYDPGHWPDVPFFRHERHREAIAAGIVTGHLIGISATGIRMRVAHNLPIRYLVPELVERYLREHGLYQEKGITPSKH